MSEEGLLAASKNQAKIRSEDCLQAEGSYSPSL